VPLLGRSRSVVGCAGQHPRTHPNAHVSTLLRRWLLGGRVQKMVTAPRRSTWPQALCILDPFGLKLLGFAAVVVKRDEDGRAVPSTTTNSPSGLSGPWAGNTDPPVTRKPLPGQADTHLLDRRKYCSRRRRNHEPCQLGTRPGVLEIAGAKRRPLSKHQWTPEPPSIAQHEHARANGARTRAARTACAFRATRRRHLNQGPRASRSRRSRRRWSALAATPKSACRQQSCCEHDAHAAAGETNPGGDQRTKWSRSDKPP
jgi:hypothetical protein